MTNFKRSIKNRKNHQTLEKRQKAYINLSPRYKTSMRLKIEINIESFEPEAKLSKSSNSSNSKQGLKQEANLRLQNNSTFRRLSRNKSEKSMISG
tara:strand:- start:2111 stop:2395 length:285 start_codon:yes stop_codon:yes gene_type:complete